MMVKDDGSDDTPISRGETDLVGRDAVYGMFGFRRYNVPYITLHSLLFNVLLRGIMSETEWRYV